MGTARVVGLLALTDRLVDVPLSVFHVLVEGDVGFFQLEVDVHLTVCPRRELQLTSLHNRDDGVAQTTVLLRLEVICITTIHYNVNSGSVYSISIVHVMIDTQT